MLTYKLAQMQPQGEPETSIFSGVDIDLSLRSADSQNALSVANAIEWQNILLYVLLFFRPWGNSPRNYDMFIGGSPPWRYNIGRLGSVLINTLFPDPLVTLSPMHVL